MPALAISMEKDTYTKQNLETKNQILINLYRKVVLQSLTLR